jgi:hypothetical protein
MLHLKNLSRISAWPKFRKEKALEIKMKIKVKILLQPCVHQSFKSTGREQAYVAL